MFAAITNESLDILIFIVFKKKILNLVETLNYEYTEQKYEHCIIVFLHSGTLLQFVA